MPHNSAAMLSYRDQRHRDLVGMECSSIQAPPSSMFAPKVTRHGLIDRPRPNKSLEQSRCHHHATLPAGTSGPTKAQPAERKQPRTTLPTFHRHPCCAGKVGWLCWTVRHKTLRETRHSRTRKVYACPSVERRWLRDMAGTGPSGRYRASIGCVRACPLGGVEEPVWSR